MPKENPPKTLLGIDYGTKNIGLAIGQTILKTATPLPQYQVKPDQSVWPLLQKIIQTWKVQAIVIGIPLNMDGTEQPLTKIVRDFIVELKKNVSVPIYEIDERLSTVEAKQQLFSAKGYRALKKTNIDSFAAKIIVEDWMNIHL